MGTERWGYSRHQHPDTWTGMHPTREEAIAQGRIDFQGGSFWIMRGEIPHASRFVPDADDIANHMGEQADGEAGESAEDFPDLTKEAREELEALLAAWSAKHLGPCPFWIGEGDPEFIDCDEGLMIEHQDARRSTHAKVTE